MAKYFYCENLKHELFLPQKFPNLRYNLLTLKKKRLFGSLVFEGSHGRYWYKIEWEKLQLSLYFNFDNGVLGSYALVCVSKNSFTC